MNFTIHIMKEEQMTDRNSWNFHLTKSIANLPDVTLEIHTEFWLSTLQRWFCGYQTPKEYKATIWGKKVDMYIAIAPFGTPTETFPVIEEKGQRARMCNSRRNNRSMSTDFKRK